MHICFITHEYPKTGLNGGGIGSFVQFIGRALVTMGHKVSVVGLNDELDYIEEEDEGVQIFRIIKSEWLLGKFHQNKERILRKINEIHYNSPIDIVEGSELNFAFFPNKTPYKKVIRLHGGHHFFAIELNKKPNFWRAYQEKTSFRKADAYVAVSNYVGKQTQKYLGYNFPYKTIYNSVDTNKFSKASREKVKENQLLFVGTVCEKKGIRQLIMAMPKIKKEIPNVHLKVLGRDWKFQNGSSYIEYLQEFIEDNVKDNIEIVGAVPHYKVPEYIEEAHVCVFPSHMEAMPIAWLEGLAMAKIVVGSNIGPGQEAIKDKITGLLVDPYSPKDIADKIIHILQNPEGAFSRANEARKDILNRFNPNNIIQQNEDFYKSLIK